jgi:alpha-amylase/alpha-mannosidase (GH57 family)
MAHHYPVHVAFLWHMHQPYYADVRTRKQIMPWVRLHGVKDYLDMVLLLAEYPDIRATFNLVPSLLEQIDDLVTHEVTDLAWDMTATPAAELGEAQRFYVVEKFFHANHANMILRYPRYKELLEKRGTPKDKGGLARAARAFSEQDLRDLQVWYNLTWIDPLHRESDPQLERLIEKGRDFTEEDKLYVLESHRRILGRIVPAYRDAAQRGQIEVSTTPFYHPILPLIYDTDVARRARPDMQLPSRRFSSPRDARAHVQDACEYHEAIFGTAPRGMWPAEGSVSPEILPLIAAAGIEWIATDEGILAQSLKQSVRRDAAGKMLNPEFLYQPYYAEHLGHRVAVVFRDRYLSDLIGFDYGGRDSVEAATDLVKRLEAVASSVRNPAHPLLVSIVLDGENCWEEYKDDGLPFLRSLYELLSSSSLVRTTRISDYLDEFPPRQTISPIHTGSWINHDFRIWIGHSEDNQAWDYLHDVRQALERHIATHRDAMSEEQIRAAWKEIMIAEGSDWNWWYGDDHFSGMDEEFDQLYREHLLSACRIAGLEPPSFLNVPIAGKTPKSPRGHGNPAM